MKATPWPRRILLLLAGIAALTAATGGFLFILHRFFAENSLSEAPAGASQTSGSIMPVKEPSSSMRKGQDSKQTAPYPATAPAVPLTAARQAETKPGPAFDLTPLGGGLKGDDYTHFLRSLTSGWAAKDPAAAAAALLAQLPPGPDRNQALREISTSWAGRDTQAALDWTANLQDDADKQIALAAIRETVPVGVGLVLQGGGDGEYPVVNETLAGSSADELAVFKKGDRIGAVSDASGKMIDVKGKPLSDIVGLIRGAPGSTVRIQFMQADAPSSTPWRVVEIARRQLLLKSP